MSEQTITGRLDSFLNEDIIDLFIGQYLHELENAFIYKAFSSWAAVRGYTGAKAWFAHQTEEEMSHANKVRDFLTDAGVNFSLIDVPIEKREITEYKDIFHIALVRETMTTDKINNIMFICGQQKQLLAQEFMNQLLYNQLSEEEEARTRYQICLNTTDTIIADLKIAELS